MSEPNTDSNPAWTARPTRTFDLASPRPWLLAVGIAALLGALFSAVSTHDFVRHLDRQVHSIHCSYIPGRGAILGASGCRDVMMSPYSSLFRESLWGGLPISLLSLAVFMYLLYRSIDFALRRDRELGRRETSFLIAATVLPVGMSILYGYIALAEVGAACQMCIGVYVSSGLATVFAILAHIRAPAIAQPEANGVWARWFGEGVVYVAVLSGMYVVLAPSMSVVERGCGTLVKHDDPSGIMFDLPSRAGATPAIVVLDPLCPGCRALERRLDAGGLTDRLDLKVVLFPLDSTCNWMLKESLHPGACALSEAILCDREPSARVLEWAFDEQESLLETSRKDGDKALRQRILERFPALRDCLGTPKIKNRLNKSLRWAVANAIPVLTPQLFVGDRRLCEEDADLGLEYSVAAMLRAHRPGPER